MRHPDAHPVADQFLNAVLPVDLVRMTFIHCASAALPSVARQRRRAQEGADRRLTGRETIPFFPLGLIFSQVRRHHTDGPVGDCLAVHVNRLVLRVQAHPLLRPIQRVDQLQARAWVAEVLSLHLVLLPPALQPIQRPLGRALLHEAVEVPQGLRAGELRGEDAAQRNRHRLVRRQPAGLGLLDRPEDRLAIRVGGVIGRDEDVA